jgi:hypothetical protein
VQQGFLKARKEEKKTKKLLKHNPYKRKAESFFLKSNKPKSKEQSMLFGFSFVLSV